VAHANPKTEGFAFSLVSAIDGGIAASAGGDDDNVLVDSGDQGDGASIDRLKFRHLAIETTFGYWLPDPYAKVILSKLNDIERGAKCRLEKFSRRLSDATDDALEHELARHVSDLQTFFKRHGQSVRPRDDLKGTFLKFLAARRKWFDDAQTRERLARRLVLTPMPDIWGDLAAVEEFELSFFEDLVFRLSLSTSKQHIVSVLSDSLKLGKYRLAVTPTEARDVLAARLKSKGWKLGDWGEPP
jgi:hypothetical protein